MAQGRIVHCPLLLPVSLWFIRTRKNQLQIPRSLGDLEPVTISEIYVSRRIAVKMKIRKGWWCPSSESFLEEKQEINVPIKEVKKNNILGQMLFMQA